MWEIPRWRGEMISSALSSAHVHTVITRGPGGYPSAASYGHLQLLVASSLVLRAVALVSSAARFTANDCIVDQGRTDTPRFVYTWPTGCTDLEPAYRYPARSPASPHQPT